MPSRSACSRIPSLCPDALPKGTARPGFWFRAYPDEIMTPAGEQPGRRFFSKAWHHLSDNPMLAP